MASCSRTNASHFSKHTLLVDKNFVGYAVRASLPANYEDVVKGVTAALEELETKLLFCESTKNELRRGTFKSVSFGSSYGGGQTVS